MIADPTELERLKAVDHLASHLMDSLHKYIIVLYKHKIKDVANPEKEGDFEVAIDSKDINQLMAGIVVFIAETIERFGIPHKIAMENLNLHLPGLLNVKKEMNLLHLDLKDAIEKIKKAET